LGLRLTTDPSCGENLEKARHYLEKCKAAADLFDRLDRAPEEWLIKCNTDDDDRCDRNRRPATIHWDPNSALLLNNDRTQSPALGLLHELAHAADRSVSEQDVIGGIESECAKALGEGVRGSHTDWKRGFRVANPVERGPVPPAPRIPTPPTIGF
jgi:hypothetical protein